MTRPFPGPSAEAARAADIVLADDRAERRHAEGAGTEPTSEADAASSLASFEAPAIPPAGEAPGRTPPRPGAGPSAAGEAFDIAAAAARMIFDFERVRCSEAAILKRLEALGPAAVEAGAIRIFADSARLRREFRDAVGYAGFLRHRIGHRAETAAPADPSAAFLAYVRAKPSRVRGRCLIALMAVSLVRRMVAMPGFADFEAVDILAGDGFTAAEMTEYGRQALDIARPAATAEMT